MIKTIFDESPLVFTLDDFYTREQCTKLINDTEKLNYELAPITVAKDTFEFQLDNRNNSRVMIDDTSLAEELFNKLKDDLPPVWKGWHLSGLNPRFRFYKYQADQKFEKHFDGRYKQDIDNTSYLTLLIYLSDDVVGGETAFFNADDESLRFKVNPRIGQVLVFDHYQLHSGEPVIDGTKYVLRTDVMYSRFPRSILT